MLAVRYQGTDNSIEPLQKHLLSPILLPPSGLITTETSSSTTISFPVTPARIQSHAPAVRILEPRTADELPPVQRPLVATSQQPEANTPVAEPPVISFGPVIPTRIQPLASAVRTLEPRIADEAPPVQKPLMATSQ